MLFVMCRFSKTFRMLLLFVDHVSARCGDQALQKAKLFMAKLSQAILGLYCTLCPFEHLRGNNCIPPFVDHMNSRQGIARVPLQANVFMCKFS